MKPFVFSCDAHINEPNDLYLNGLPQHLQPFALHREIVEGKNKKLIILKMGETELLRLELNFWNQSHKNGLRDLDGRFKDMELDGVDAELVFANLALVAHRIPNAEAELATARLFNDWVCDFVKDHRHKLVPVAILPVHDLAAGLAEFQRVVAKGFTAVMIPVVPPAGVPQYNDPAWEPIFAYAAAVEVPLVFHTGTGDVNIRAERGAGAALFNYTRQMNDSVDTITRLVGGGILDRNPKAKIMFAEHGAGWLLGLAERMDEVYDGHNFYIEPKLGRRPSQIVRDQVVCSFQNDIGCLLTRKGVGINALVFATDYPHHEGTFPHSRELVERMFDNVPDITEEEKAAVLGLNAARMFKLDVEKAKAQAAA